MNQKERSPIKPSIQEVRQMMLDRIPRKKIAELTGYRVWELCRFAQAWEIPAYSKLGRPRKDENQSAENLIPKS